MKWNKVVVSTFNVYVTPQTLLELKTLFSSNPQRYAIILWAVLQSLGYLHASKNKIIG